MKSLSILLTILCILTCKVNANIFDSFSQFNDQTPGCAVGVVNNDKLVYEHYVGQANLRYQVPINNKTLIIIKDKADCGLITPAGISRVTVLGFFASISLSI